MMKTLSLTLKLPTTKQIGSNFYKLPLQTFFLSNWSRSSRHQDAYISPKGNIEDILYYKQMKEFIKESQGVPRNSQKWFNLRNKHYKLLQEKQVEAQSKFKESMDVQYLRFYVLIVPEQTICYELVSILNFYQIRYKALEDSPVSKSIMKQMLGIFSQVDYRKMSFPFLMFETSEDPMQNFDGFDNILKFLIENNFIHDYRSHTVYEKDGVKFTEGFEDCLGKEMKKFGNKFSFFFRTTNFKEARYWYHPHKDSYVYRSRLVSRLYRLGKSILSDFKFSIQKRKNKKIFFEENEVKLINLMKTWIERLNKNAFHGGDVPDAADFKLYSIFRKFSNCRLINFKLKSFYNGTHKSATNTEGQDAFLKFEDWYAKMSMLCSRSSHYNIRDVGYNYNRHMSEEILEASRINKPSESKEEDIKGSGSNKINKNKIMGVFGNKTKRNKVSF